ncbi:energy transducer TonB [Muriicola soli]|uniref:Energy transducer TonB n=1 Tax=Muriicola soli TaxID=2507538 RepID=A0A411EB05_9FLAO|nr:energy transducer TonB [Muriicola soli]QBA64912.1 energy transducer TonB [Muriicola soli]
MSFLDTRHKKKSFSLTVFLLSALLLLLFYIGLTYMEPPIEKGITVNFGSMEFGSGREQPKELLRPAQNEAPEKSEPEKEAEVLEEEEEPLEETAPDKVAEEVLTQQREEAIKIEKQKEAKKKAEEAAEKKRREEERIERERLAAIEKAKQEEEAKKRKLDALMGGINNADGTAQGNEGDDQLPGDKGQADGDPYATSYYGTPGSGSGTGGYGLNGRSLVNQGKVQQECNEEGRVVVRIVVDRNGKVIDATPGVKGTTNNHPCLLAPARKTAFLHRWNLDQKAPNQQVGFVVVNFKLGE